MTAQERQLVKQAIDARARQRMHAFVLAGELQVCAGCGCEQALRTPGCRTCANRHRMYARRTDPAYQAYWREYDRNRRMTGQKAEAQRLRRLRAQQSA